MGYIIAGNASLQLLKLRRRRNSEGAWQTEVSYKGLESDCLAFVAGLPDDSEVDITPDDDSPFATLTYTIGDAQDGGEPSEESLKPQWSLLSNELEKDLYEYPGIAATIEDTAEAIQTIEEGLAFVQENPSAVPTQYADIVSFFGALAGHIFLLKAQGQASFTVSAFVLQRTVNLPKGYSEKWDTANVGKQYTTAQLTAAEEIPDTIKFTMPEGIWIKKAPQIVPDGSGRFQVTDEWTHADAASTIIYPPVE